MYTQKKYKQMLIYIEACEAGSMFNNILSEQVNVLAVTASDPTHSSYAIYYDDTRKTFLGDVFSVFWMQDSEQESMTETVQHQFDVVQQLTNTSAVCAYGDMTINPEALKVFQAPPTFGTAAMPRTPSPPLPAGEVMDSRDINIAVLRHHLDAAEPSERPRLASLLNAALLRRQKSDDRIKHIADSATVLVGRPVDFLAQPPRGNDICHDSVTVQDQVCLKEMVITMKKICGAFDDYSLKHIRVLNSFCAAGIAPSNLVRAMTEACSA